MKKLALALVIPGGPALAASGPFFSLYNTNFVVLLSFLAFIAVLVYLRVPGRLAKMLDGRAARIRRDLDEARALREEAQTVLASYERRQKDVQEQAARIIETARIEAEAAAAKAKEDLRVAIERRLAAADEQIESAKAGAVKEVRDRAVAVAVAVARDEIARKMTDHAGNKLVDSAIREVKSKLRPN